MEMEMRAKEDVDIATDITHPIVPLSYCLQDSFVHSHCSSCFSLLPSPPHHHLSSLFYCSNQCLSSDSSLHFSSAENHLLLLPHLPDETSDLRAALRFLHSQRLASHSGRIAGLVINRDKLMSHDDELSQKIRNGARAMAAAIMMQCGCEELEDAVFEDAMTVLCLVLTNAVEVHDSSGRTLGIAVYDPNFCWINHSCSPNAIYRFAFCSPHSPPLPSGQLNLRIALFTRNSQGLKIEINSELCCSSSELEKEGKQNYGPRITVRSIKRIRKGEEVTVTYTDLLQPKAMRQSELWSRYRFICCCRRCTASPFTCVDHALQGISTVSLDSTAVCYSCKYYRDEAARILTKDIDDVISEYLSIGNPESCCQKLENILTEGLKEQLAGDEGKSRFTFKLHPLSHLSLNAYTTLASAYKVHATDLFSLYSETDENQLEAFDMSRTGAAYSLLLAGATHHLFNSEPSLIASLANFWIGAGESLLSLSRSSGWSELVKPALVDSDLFSLTKFKCLKCSIMTRFIACKSNGHVKSADLEGVSSEFLQCVTYITQKVWRFLVHGCEFLRLFKDPVNFSWLVATKNFRIDMGSSSHESERSVGIGEEQGDTEQGREHIFRLGVHCLVYGGFLAIICYGNHSQMTCHVHNILDHEGSFIDCVHKTF